MTAAAPSILDSMDNWGAFIFYATWCAIALIYVFLVVPEIATLSLESVNEVFRGPWYTAFKRTKSIPQNIEAFAKAYPNSESGKHQVC